jgi:hypothetical protein
MSGAVVAVIVLGVLAALGFGGCGVCVVVTAVMMPEDAGAPTPVVKVTPDAQQKSSPVVVPLADLLAQYHADAGAADTRYRGVYVQVAGVVSLVDVHGWVALRETPSHAPKVAQAFDTDSVKCKWKDGAFGMPDFKVGERATIVGYVETGSDLGVFLADCAKR